MTCQKGIKVAEWTVLPSLQEVARKKEREGEERREICAKKSCPVLVLEPSSAWERKADDHTARRQT